MRMAQRYGMGRAAAVLLVVFLGFGAQAQQEQQQPQTLPLYESIDQLLVPFQTRTDEQVTLSAKVTYKTKRGEDETAQATFSRVSPSAFALTVNHPRARFVLSRSDERVFLHLLDKDLLFMGEGALSGPGAEAFTLTNLAGDLDTRSQLLTAWVGTLKTARAVILAPIAMAAGYAINPAPATETTVEYTVDKGEKRIASLSVDRNTRALSRAALQLGGASYIVEISLKWEAQLPPLPAEARKVSVDRAEFERALLKCVGRVLEILAEDFAWRPPMDTVKIGTHGKYRVKDGQRIVYLEGSPYEIGFQHGQFLRDEARRTLEGPLYVAGIVYSVERGTWFLNDLRAAVARLEPHVPQEYTEELKGLAVGSGIPYECVRIANYFPELFHCSGFAVGGKATVGGKLYHGRVLDYMTDVGLQYNAAVFAVRKKGKIPFVNVGYAGFIGSVTGMNEKKVALGEMGGGGQGKWDGVPMTTLMRMALEDASTLDEVKSIFSKHPRTCEYYYVFSDGKDRSAVGVKAVPESIEFLKPGEAHPLLPTPVEDCVLLSAGGRYKSLCKLVQEQYGKIGPEQALKLMDSPVAMRSNLHLVLFCPETLELWVANAGRKSPAYAERFYHYTLPELLSDGFYPIPAEAK